MLIFNMIIFKLSKGKKLYSPYIYAALREKMYIYNEGENRKIGKSGNRKKYSMVCRDIP